MGVLWVLAILFLTYLAWGTLRYPKQAYINIRQFPRDSYGIYKYIQSLIYAYSNKMKNMTAAKYFDKVAKKRSMQACLLFEDEVWTFKRVRETSLKIAKYFKNAGYKKGDVVGLFMENRPEFVCIWLGLGRLGIVTSFLNYNLKLESLEHCIKTSNCTGLIFGTELTDAIQELIDASIINRSSGNLSNLKLYSFADRTPPKQKLSLDHVNLSEELNSIPKIGLDKEDFGVVNNNDLGFHLFTSGTSGLPKAAKMRYSRMISFGAAAKIQGLNPDKDVLLTAVPLYHIQAGIIGTSCALFHGIPQVIIRKFSASKFWDQCIKYDATICQYIGEILRYLYNQPEKKEDRLHKVAYFAGNGTNPAIWNQFVKRFNVKILEGYASTEGNCTIANLQCYPGAVGYLPSWLYPFLPIFSARVDPITRELIRDPKSGFLQPADRDEEGELLTKIISWDPQREFEGYTDEQATRAKIVENVSRKGDRWFRTGDILMTDENGYIYFKDRTGDTFRWKGENVSTTEVEQVIANATGKAVAVYGVKVAGTEGRCGMACVSDTAGNLNLPKLSKAVTTNLPSYARPIFIRIAKSELATTGTFKVEKLKLQKEGFDPKVVKDSLFFLQEEEYVPLTDTLYDGIISGKLRF